LDDIGMAKPADDSRFVDESFDKVGTISSRSIAKCRRFARRSSIGKSRLCRAATHGRTLLWMLDEAEMLSRE
jgi:hypothetical protein